MFKTMLSTALAVFIGLGVIGHSNKAEAQKRKMVQFKRVDKGWKKTNAISHLGNYIYMFLRTGSLYQVKVNGEKVTSKKVDKGWKKVRHVATNGRVMIALLSTGSLYKFWHDRTGKLKFLKIDKGWKKASYVTSFKGKFYIVLTTGSMYQLKVL